MKIEFRYRFEAAHRFLNSDSKMCMTPHGHTWYATMALSFIGPALNSSQMTVEFSQLKKQWKSLIESFFDHSYMHNINDPIVEVLKADSDHLRLIPFPGDPTTELIALFMFQKMSAALSSLPFHNAVRLDAIALEETPTNKIICDREFFEKEIANFQMFQGWWQTADITDRSLRVP